MRALRLIVFLAACAPQWTEQPEVQFCAGTCGLEPAAPLPKECHADSAKYDPNGTPTKCYYVPELNRVADTVRACSNTLGIVAAEYHFDRDGMPRSVRATSDCEFCKQPKAIEEGPFLRCVERATSAARLPLAPGQNEFRVIFLYRVGVPEDPRLDLGWAPLEPGTH